MTKFLVSLLLVGQFVMTPERKAAMQEESVKIRSQQAAVTQLQQADIESHQQLLIKIGNAKKEKIKLIEQAKKKLGLDNTWNWSDDENTFVQTK